MKNTPFALLGGEEVVRRIVTAFYDRMERDHAALTALHRLTPDGRISSEVRERFALFFIGWLGGPQTYMERHGHPRLRMRHGHVRIDEAMRDAWLAAMRSALDDCAITGDNRAYLLEKLSSVANFLRNAE